MRLFVALMALVALVGSASAHVYFSSKFTITADSLMPGGTATGTMYYFYNTTTDAYNHFQRIDYKTPINMIELTNYTSATRYKYCGTCYAEKYPDQADNLFYTTGSTRCASEDYGNCLCYSRTSGTVKKYWVLSTDTEVLCKATVTKASGATRTYMFTQYNKTVPAGTFTIRNGWTCPAPICRRVMDIVLVFDESGSISSTEWTQMINFATQLVNQFEVSIDATNFGVVYFAWKSRLISKLVKDKSSVINALATGSIGGNTCIGCGITVGIQNVLPYKVTGRAANPAEIMITLTDGGNNSPDPGYCYYGYYCGYTGTAQSNLTASVGLITNRGVTSIAIGVGSGYVYSQLDLIASDITGVQTIIEVGSFAQLPSIIEKLVSNTCTDLPVYDCGINCKAFCGCNQQCICPVCPEINACYKNNCTVNAAGQSAGCVITPVNFNDNNACTNDWCDNATGVHHSNVTCDDGNACTQNQCSMSTGCYFPQRTDCDKGDPCYSYGCDTTTGCTEDYLCDNDPCYTGVCTATGCSYTWACDDGNACTHDFCNTAGTHFCDHTAVDPATECNDGLTCTDDLCLSSMAVTPGCVHPAHDCNNGAACKDMLCNTTLDQCVDDPKTDCTICGQAISAGLDCSLNVPTCQRGNCRTSTTTGQAECFNVDLDCSAPLDMCNNHFCNMSTDACDSSPKVCAHPNPCTLGKCDPATGDCYIVDRNCSAEATIHDPCWIDYCDAATDSCMRKPFCEPHTCEVATCTATGNTASCDYDPVDCSTGSQCVDGNCDPTTGQCVLTQVQCSDGKLCTKDECNKDTRCVFTNLTCDDGDICTNDFCNEVVGCYHTFKCDDGLFCTEDICNLDGSCTNRELTCNLDFSTPDKKCFVEACSEERHCYYKTSNTAFLDVCGNCIQTYDTNITVWNNSWIRTACVDSMTWPEYVAVLTAAALAGIIIAAIIIAIIMAIGGFFGTKELIKRAKLASGQAAQNNPLYQDSGREMANPAYTGQQ